MSHYVNKKLTNSTSLYLNINQIFTPLNVRYDKRLSLSLLKFCSRHPVRGIVFNHDVNDDVIYKTKNNVNSMIASSDNSHKVIKAGTLLATVPFNSIFTPVTAHKVIAELGGTAVLKDILHYKKDNSNKKDVEEKACCSFSSRDSLIMCAALALARNACAKLNASRNNNISKNVGGYSSYLTSKSLSFETRLLIHLCNTMPSKIPNYAAIITEDKEAKEEKLVKRASKSSYFDTVEEKIALSSSSTHIEPKLSESFPSGGVVDKEVTVTENVEKINNSNNSIGDKFHGGDKFSEKGKKGTDGAEEKVEEKELVAALSAFSEDDNENDTLLAMKNSLRRAVFGQQLRLINQSLPLEAALTPRTLKCFLEQQPISLSMNKQRMNKTLRVEENTALGQLRGLDSALRATVIDPILKALTKGDQKRKDSVNIDQRERLKEKRGFYDKELYDDDDDADGDEVANPKLVQDIRWAHAMLRSRAVNLAYENISPDVNNLERPLIFLSIVPFVDLLNHSASSPNVSFTFKCNNLGDNGGNNKNNPYDDVCYGKENFCLITATRDIFPGESLTINYENYRQRLILFEPNPLKAAKELIECHSTSPSSSSPSGNVSAIKKEYDRYNITTKMHLIEFQTRVDNLDDNVINQKVAIHHQFKPFISNDHSNEPFSPETELSLSQDTLPPPSPQTSRSEVRNNDDKNTKEEASSGSKISILKPDNKSNELAVAQSSFSNKDHSDGKKGKIASDLAVREVANSSLSSNNSSFLFYPDKYACVMKLKGASRKDAEWCFNFGFIKPLNEKVRESVELWRAQLPSKVKLLLNNKVAGRGKRGGFVIGVPENYGAIQAHRLRLQNEKYGGKTVFPPQRI